MKSSASAVGAIAYALRLLPPPTKNLYALMYVYRYVYVRKRVRRYSQPPRYCRAPSVEEVEVRPPPGFAFRCVMQLLLRK